MDNNGGNPVNGYLVEWYSKHGSSEIQRVTTSATDGRTEIQVVRTTANKKGLTGKFALFSMENLRNLLIMTLQRSAKVHSRKNLID